MPSPHLAAWHGSLGDGQIQPRSSMQSAPQPSAAAVFPSTVSGCTSTCGDGILIPGDTNEECDDGNKKDGDGCSSTCKVEPGYKCDNQQGTLPASITIPFVFR